MKTITKIMSLLIVGIILVLAFASCNGNTQQTTTEKDKTETTSEVTTKEADTTEAQTTVETTEETTTEQTTTEETTTVEETEHQAVQEFDMNDVVLAFGLTSDIHINNSGDAASSKFATALVQLKKKAKELGVELDAIVSTGDITNSGTIDQYKILKSIYESNMGKATPFVFVLGNHDQYQPLSNAYDIFNTEQYTGTMVDDSLIKYGNVHYVLNGIHFVAICPNTYSSGNYSCPFTSKTKNWLDETLETITTEDPGAPVFVLVHPMIYDTAYGSTLEVSTQCCWYTTELTDILSQYPQVIALSGHLHFTVNDERCIMQTDFTTIGCGSTSYMAVMNGGYENMSSATVMNDAQQVSDGYLFLVDSKGNVKVVRMDFSNKSETKEPWIIPAPEANKSHLNFYRTDRKYNDNPAPVFGTENVIYIDNVAKNASGYLPKFCWQSATDDDMVFLYEVSIMNESGVVIQKWKFLSDYYRVTDAKDMKTEYSVQNRIAGGRLSFDTEYTIRIIAFDCWENASDPAVMKFTGNSDGEITITYTSFKVTEQ